MTRRIIYWFAGVLLILGVFLGWFYIHQSSLAPFTDLKNIVTNDALKVSDTLTTFKESSDKPLRKTGTAAPTQLTVAGVITQTNQQRHDNGDLAALKENAQLDAAAEVKVKDMFTNQYFEHVSPSGKSASDLARQEGYAFFLIGENLALGNYGNDQGVVQAWMDSPGHRANILRPQYREIGVAVMQGVFQGQKTWLAVQEFGTPQSVCDAPNSALKNQITADQNQAQALQSQLEALKAEIDAMNPKFGSEYNAKVQEYNALVAQYNSLVEKLKQEIAQFNTQVDTYNTCVNQYVGQ